jgi:hypothetical protein
VHLAAAISVVGAIGLAVFIAVLLRGVGIDSEDQSRANAEEDGESPGPTASAPASELTR